MSTPTTTYAFDKPTVGGDADAWGTLLNGNWDKVDDLLDGTTGITPNLLTGWEVGGVAVTSTAAELNVLDGITATVTELNYTDGVTSNIQTQLDGKQALDADLTAISALTGTGFLVRTGAGTYAERTINAGSGISVTFGNGVAANVVIDVAALTVAQFSAAAIVTEAEGLNSSDSDNSLPTTAAVKDYVDNAVSGGNALTLDTAQATTSGSTKDFTAPFTPKRITVILDGVSAGANSIGIRLGDAGGIETTGYSAQLWTISTAPSVGESITETGRFLLSTTTGTWSGNIFLTNVNGNVWVLSGTVYDENSGTTFYTVGGKKELSDVLTTVRLIGGGNFTAGQVNVLWE